jgi:hypothetical protein
MHSGAGDNTQRAGVVSCVSSRIKGAIGGLARRLRSARILSTKLKSGTPEYPTRIAVFNAAVDNLVNQARFSDRIYFRSAGRRPSPICQVGWAAPKHPSLSWHPTELEVRIGLPHTESFPYVFGKRGVEIPGCWRLDRFKRGKWAQFRFAKEYAETIGPFLDAVYRQVYGCSEDCVVGAYIPPDYDHFV